MYTCLSYEMYTIWKKLFLLYLCDITNKISLEHIAKIMCKLSKLLDIESLV